MSVEPIRYTDISESSDCDCPSRRICANIADYVPLCLLTGECALFAQVITDADSSGGVSKEPSPRWPCFDLHSASLLVEFDQWILCFPG